MSPLNGAFRHRFQLAWPKKKNNNDYNNNNNATHNFGALVGNEEKDVSLPSSIVNIAAVIPPLGVGYKLRDQCRRCIRDCIRLDLMKYQQPVAMPASVQDWLDRELEMRGIDAVVYTRYILSILQQETFDSEPAERELFPTEAKRNLKESPLSKGKGKSKPRAERRKSLDSEEIKKSAAVECLMSVSEQKSGIVKLVDDLCVKLKSTQSESYSVSHDTLDDSKVCTETIILETNSQASSSPEEQAKKYYAAFPALNGIKEPSAEPAAQPTEISSVWDLKKVVHHSPVFEPEQPGAEHEKSSDKESNPIADLKESKKAGEESEGDSSKQDEYEFVQPNDDLGVYGRNGANHDKDNSGPDHKSETVTGSIHKTYCKGKWSTACTKNCLEVSASRCRLKKRVVRNAGLQQQQHSEENTEESSLDNSFEEELPGKAGHNTIGNSNRNENYHIGQPSRDVDTPPQNNLKIEEHGRLDESDASVVGLATKFNNDLVAIWSDCFGKLPPGEWKNCKSFRNQPKLISPEDSDNCKNDFPQLLLGKSYSSARLVESIWSSDPHQHTVSRQLVYSVSDGIANNTEEKAEARRSESRNHCQNLNDLGKVWGWNSTKLLPAAFPSSEVGPKSDDIVSPPMAINLEKLKLRESTGLSLASKDRSWEGFDFHLGKKLSRSSKSESSLVLDQHRAGGDTWHDFGLNASAGFQNFNNISKHYPSENGIPFDNRSMPQEDNYVALDTPIIWQGLLSGLGQTKKNEVPVLQRSPSFHNRNFGAVGGERFIPKCYGGPPMGPPLIARSYDSYLNKMQNCDDDWKNTSCRLAGIATGSCHSEPLPFSANCTLKHHKGESRFMEVKPRNKSCDWPSHNTHASYRSCDWTTYYAGSAAAPSPAPHIATMKPIGAISRGEVEVENLFISMKTHFRPIQEDSDDVVAAASTIDERLGETDEADPPSELEAPTEDPPVCLDAGFGGFDCPGTENPDDSSDELDKELRLLLPPPSKKLVSSSEKHCQTDEEGSAEGNAEECVEDVANNCETFLNSVVFALDSMINRKMEDNSVSSAQQPLESTSCSSSTCTTSRGDSADCEGLDDDCWCERALQAYRSDTDAMGEYMNSKYLQTAGDGIVGGCSGESSQRQSLFVPSDSSEVKWSTAQEEHCEGNQLMKYAWNTYEVEYLTKRTDVAGLDSEAAGSDDNKQGVFFADDRCDWLMTFSDGKLLDKGKLLTGEEGSEGYAGESLLDTACVESGYDDDRSSGEAGEGIDAVKSGMATPTLDSMDDEEDCPELEMINKQGCTAFEDNHSNLEDDSDDVEDVVYAEKDLYSDYIFQIQTLEGLFKPNLPVVPTNKVVYVSDLEQEWRNSGKPFDVQVPKKNRSKLKSMHQKRPCSFYLEGNCRRTDCKFSHDLSTITCRFWEEECCFKGITCPFLHGYQNDPDKENAEENDFQLELDSEAHFPSLAKPKGHNRKQQALSNSSSSDPSPLTPSRRKRKRYPAKQRIMRRSGGSADIRPKPMPPGRKTRSSRKGEFKNGHSSSSDEYPKDI